jgi:hypothetical protein
MNVRDHRDDGNAIAGVFFGLAIELVVLIVVLMSCGAVKAAAATTTGPNTISYLFGRTMVDQGGPKCSVLPGANTIYDAADFLASRGLSATAVSTVNQTGETGRICQGSLLYASWADLATLRDTYGWTAASRGMTGVDITGMTTAQATAESCGSIDVFDQHGFDVRSEYAYAGNTQNTTTRSIVASCFTYGRAYGSKSVSLPVAAPYIAKAVSITGGACWNPALSCYGMTVKNSRRYFPVDQLIGIEGQAGWMQMQFYRLVSGSYGSTSGTGPAWDCSSPDWHDHWTRIPETYCFADFQSIVDGRPLSSSVLSPGEVAGLYGRK